MIDKNRDEETGYIIDRLRARKKKENENEEEIEKENEDKVEKEEKSTDSIKENTSETRQAKSVENEDIADMELGCYFFLILPFIASILFLIILIALLR